MNAARLKELLALAMIGEGVVAMLYPRQHALLWRVGPRPLRGLVGWFADRPRLTRAMATAEVGAGLWLATSQLAPAALPGGSEGGGRRRRPFAMAR